MKSFHRPFCGGSLVVFVDRVDGCTICCGVPSPDVSASDDLIESALEPIRLWASSRQGPLPPGWKRDT